MRPSEEILSEFYDLVELDATKRFNAIGRLLTKTKQDASSVDYCIERLVTGLSSPRGAARLGYSTALVLLLSEFYESWTAERLFEVADKKLDLHDKDSGNANAVGRHMLAYAILQTKVYAEVDVFLLERELEVYRLYPSLGLSIAQTIAEIALEMEKSRFKQGVLPLIKDYLGSALTSSSVEFVYLALLLKDRFPKYIAESVSFVRKDGSCHFSDSDLTYLVLILKKCDSSYLASFLKLLLISSRKSGQFEEVYRNVVEKWCLSGDESKVLEKIFDTAKITLSIGDNTYKEVLAVFSPFLLKRITLTVRGKQNAHQRLIREKITDFCKFTENVLESVKEDSELLEIISALDTTESFDSLTGSNLIDHLIGRLSHDGVVKWIQMADKPWSLRHVCAAYPLWGNEARVEALTTLLQRPCSQEIQYAVGNCIDSMFKIKVRAGELVNVALVDGGEDVLRKTAVAVFGKDVVKSGMKKMRSSPCESSALSVFWLCVKLWSKMASSEEVSNAYASNADELLLISKGEEGSLKVLIDQLLALLSQPIKYHRSVIYHVYVHLLPHINEEHVGHIIETLMMNDHELAGDAESEGRSSDGESSDMEEQGAEAVDLDESSESEKSVDPEHIERLESALGKAAVKRKAEAENEEETDVSDVGDEEMFAMDDSLAAAFKAMVPKKENKLAVQQTAAFRMRLADLLLFTISSQSTPAPVKISMMVPLLKLAKLQLKQDAEGQLTRKTIGLLNMLSRLKKLELADEKVVELLDLLVTECTAISNPALVSAVAALSSFIFSLGVSSEGVPSETVLSAFVGLFERFMTQEDGLIGSKLAIAAAMKHPELFIQKADVFLEASFNESFRVFRRTEALLCLARMLGRGVLNKVSVKKSTIKGIAKSSSIYLRMSVSQPETIKPRFFASVLKLLQSVTSSIGDDLKPTLQKYFDLDGVMNEETLKEVSKKVNSACQQVCGKSVVRVLEAIQKAVA